MVYGYLFLSFLSVVHTLNQLFMCATINNTNDNNNNKENYNKKLAIQGNTIIIKSNYVLHSSPFGHLVNNYTFSQ